jgi:hypothetical protein
VSADLAGIPGLIRECSPGVLVEHPGLPREMVRLRVIVGPIRQEWPGVGEPLGPEWAKVSIEWAEGVSADLGAPGLWVSGGNLIYTASAAVWCTHGRGFCATVED